MSLTSEQRDALEVMRGIVESYRTLRIDKARVLKRLALDHFKIDLDIAPTIAAVQSRRGDVIIAEINRLQDAVREMEARGE